MIHQTVHRRQISENRKTASVNKKELREKFVYFSCSHHFLEINLFPPMSVERKCLKVRDYSRLNNSLETMLENKNLNPIAIPFNFFFVLVSSIYD